MFSGVRDMFDGLKERLGKLLDGLTAWMPDVLPASPFLRALMLVVPGVLIVAAVIWRRRKRRKMEAKVLEQMGEGGRKRERGLYFQLLLLLARYGFQKRASETPREFAQRVLRRGGDQHAAILELTELYYGLRFGERSLEAEFKAALARYADGLRDQRGQDRAQGPGSSASPAGAQPG
jgi:hypothetical protein